MKIVFMGTPDFAVPTLQMLIDEGHEISLVVSQPDRPKGRGKKENMPPVKELALKYNIPVAQPVRVRGDEVFYDNIKALNPDVIVVVAFGQILPESILNIPHLGCINVHGSLLPEYRGAAPIQWSVINRESVTGVTIMYMDKGMDTGDMLMKREMPIDAQDTYKTLHDKMMSVGADALKEALPVIMAGGMGREKQDDSKATYAPMISKALGEIDFSKSALEIDALVRGLDPWPVAYTYYEGQPLKVWKTSVSDQEAQGEAGKILDITKEGLYVQTGEGVIVIEDIQAPNKRRMPVVEYIKGNTVTVGEVLGK